MIKSFAKTLLLVFLFSTATYATNTDTAPMGASLELFAPLDVELRANMLLPSIFADQTPGTFTSEDTTSIPSGHNGRNALVCVKGEPGTQYSLFLKSGSTTITTATITNGTTNLTVSLSIVGDATGRPLDGSGANCAEIRGSVNIPTMVESGHYVSEHGSVTVEVSYD